MKEIPGNLIWYRCHKKGLRFQRQRKSQENIAQELMVPGKMKFIKDVVWSV
jgi:hypothetical protein